MTDVKPFNCTHREMAFKTHGELKKRNQTHGEGRHCKCTTCEKAFKQLTQLVCHEQLHTGPIPAVIAENRLNDKSISLGMKGETPVNCLSNHSVRKMFRRRHHLKYHEKIHSDVKSYKCTQCEISFRLEPNLRVHLNIYFGMKPYKCTYCDKCFASSSELKTHKNTHW